MEPVAGEWRAEKLVVHVAGDAFCQTADIFYTKPHRCVTEYYA